MLVCAAKEGEINVIDDTNEAASSGEGAGLDPREAATILEQANRQARRQFDPQPPLVVVLGAAGVFLFGYGAVWWSMRDQHVYTTGPALWSLAVLYGLIAVSAIVGSVVFNRATSGVSGRARRQQQAQAAAFAAAGIGAWVVQGALRYRGVSFEIVYGVFGPTVPLIALVAVAAGINAMRESWLQLGVCIAIIAVTSVSTFFGPLGAWGFTGLGCCLVLLAYAAILVVQQRRA
jgi:hypothetical protein